MLQGIKKQMYFLNRLYKNYLDGQVNENKVQTINIIEKNRNKYKW